MVADPNLSQTNLDNPVEIVITRTLAAPRELVWQVWTDAKHVGNWWGPAGFKTTTHELDFRPGGSWRYTMHGPDGTDYLCRVDYIETEPPSRLVYRLCGEGDNNSGTSFRSEVTFEQAPDGKQTMVTMRSIFPSAKARDFVISNFGALEGGKQHLASLEDYVEQVQSENDEPAFTISQVFKAPREQLWQSWTEREHLLKWFGPKGSTMTHAKLELRVGGLFHYCMSQTARMELWGCWTFQVIDPPNKLVFVSSFSNPAGEIAPAPFQGLEDFPLKIFTTVTFVDHAGIGKGTLVTIEARPHAGSSKAQREFFKNFHSSMHAGWTGTMEQLAEFVDERGTGCS
ncbi:MAG: SRPBCC family protein [Pirellulales bacterium]